MPGRPLYNIASAVTTVVPTKSDSDVIFCLQFVKKNFNLYTPLELITCLLIISCG